MQRLLKPTRAKVIATVLVSGAGGAALRTSSSEDASSTTLNARSFTPFTLTSKEAASPTSTIFTLHPPTPASRAQWQDQWRKGIWSVEIKQPQLQIARAYTPLPPAETPEAQPRTQNSDEESLSFLVRATPRGEMSGYLHALPPQSRVGLRGPKTEYEVPRDVSRVVFLAGGTGIAPAMQMAYALRDADVRIDVLWGVRRREECVGGVSDGGDAGDESRAGGWRAWCGFGSSREEAVKVESNPGSAGGAELGPVVERLEGLKRLYKGRENAGLKVQYFVDEEGTFVKPGRVQTLVDQQTEVASGKKLLVVSGPEGLVNYWAGPKEWQGGKEVQGPLGGVLGQMKLSGWEVVKL